jgi:hypothetical protein
MGWNESRLQRGFMGCHRCRVNYYYINLVHHHDHNHVNLVQLYTNSLWYILTTQWSTPSWFMKHTNAGSISISLQRLLLTLCPMSCSVYNNQAILAIAATAARTSFRVISKFLWILCQQLLQYLSFHFFYINFDHSSYSK